MKTLIIFSHTFFKDSKVNKILLDKASSLSNVLIQNLNAIYPSGQINAQKEIELLQIADKIVFQFPMFWYSTPSIMKQWQDVVLSAVAFGENSGILKGKKFQIISTIGGAESSYDGHHGYSIDAILSPINSAFKYCGCDVEKAYCIFSANAQNLNIDKYLANLG